MRVLFDLVHPADALFFHHPIAMLKGSGARVGIVSRHKDVLVPLLDGLGHEHQTLTTAGDGLFGLCRELISRDWQLLRLARQFRPEVMASFGGVSVSHVGRVLGIPSLSFYDTEHATLQNRLALPFISEWHVPECWQGPEAKGRTFRFRASKQFAYLSPNHFVPDERRAKGAGWDESRDNFLIRLVAWKASHDIGRSGIGREMLHDVANLLAAHGRLHISAEGSLPDELERNRYRGSPVDFHHLLAMCRLCFGESITVASEAVMLGVPAIVSIDKEYGYVREQEAAGLLRRVGDRERALQAVREALQEDPQVYRQRSRAFVATKEDINQYVVDTISRVAARRLNRYRTSAPEAQEAARPRSASP